MGYRYYICDVFTNTRFGGNQLAVLPEATGLSDRQMQQVAREFNFSESAFVLPAERGQTRRVRISPLPARFRLPGIPMSGRPSCWRRPARSVPSKHPSRSRSRRRRALSLIHISEPTRH